jgi:hypothetical protein
MDRASKAATTLPSCIRRELNHDDRQGNDYTARSEAPSGLVTRFWYMHYRAADLPLCARLPQPGTRYRAGQ